MNRSQTATGGASAVVASSSRHQLRVCEQQHKCACHRRGLPDSATMISLLLELLLALASLSRPARSPNRIVVDNRTENMHVDAGVSEASVMRSSPLKCSRRELNLRGECSDADGFGVGIASVLLCAMLFFVPVDHSSCDEKELEESVAQPGPRQEQHVAANGFGGPPPPPLPIVPPRSPIPCCLCTAVEPRVLAPRMVAPPVPTHGYRRRANAKLLSSSTTTGRLSPVATATACDAAAA